MVSEWCPAGAGPSLYPQTKRKKNFFLATPRSLLDIISLTRDPTYSPHSESTES